VGVKASGLSAGYDGHPVLEGVDLEVRPGELLAIVGPNGSGKTTLLRALAGTLKPTAGTATVGGAEVFGLPARERARRLAVVPQSNAVEFAFTVREVVEMGRTPYLTGLGTLSKADRAAVDKALERAGVTALADRVATDLSAGQGQLVSIARALAQESTVLLLDEPTAHLDVTHQIEVMGTVRRLAHEGNMACAAVLHDLNLAAAFADRIMLLAKGRARACGAPAEVLTRANIAATFGLDVLVRRHPVSGAFFVVPVSVSVDPEAPAPSAPRHRRVHLVCGGGTGAQLMAGLARAGAELSVGVLNVLDSDFELAEALGVRVVAEAPFSAVTPAAADEARRLALAADAVVLAAVPFGASNLANLGVVEDAAAAGKPVYLVDAEGALKRDFTGGEAPKRLAACGPGAAKSRRSTRPNSFSARSRRSPQRSL
jgi:iron complex transport system ATP-binding protein